MRRILHTGLSPNAERDDVLLAASLFLRPWEWKRGTAAADLEERFERLFSRPATSFNSGRTCLLVALQTLGLVSGDEVLLQAFTCVAVPDPVIWAGARPIYVDCDETLTMDPNDLERNITPRSKVLIIQHTFGRPANMEHLMEIALKYKLFVIEDCAHALGARSRGRLLGSFGDVAFFSFGRDKVISSVFGGMMIATNEKRAIAIRSRQEHAPLPSRTWIAQQLFHPPFLSLVKATYGFLSTGKVLAEIGKRMQLISKSVLPIEKKGGKPPFVGQGLPNALAFLAIHQFDKMERINSHRQKIAKIYHHGLQDLTGIRIDPWDGERVWLRYCIRTNRRGELMRIARRNGIYLGDWYDVPIAPFDVDVNAIGYVQGSCPKAERIATEIVNLPTHIGITHEDAERIVSVTRSVCH